MNLRDHFPRASQSFLSCNSGTLSHTGEKNCVQPIVATRRGKMNKTEAEYAMILEAMKRKGEILHYEFEGITLRFAGVRYTPDFVVFHDKYVNWRDVPEDMRSVANPTIKLIEVKGPFVKGNRERAVERFRHANTYWRGYLQFEMHQKTKEGWKQII